MFVKISILLLVLESAFSYNLRMPSIVRRHSPLFMSEMATEETPVHQVFIGNLPFEVSEDDLNNLVTEKAGATFKQVRLIKDRATGRSRGFAYVDYEEKDVAETAIAALTGTDIDGREIKVDLSVPKGERKTNRPPQENSVFLGNLDFGATEEQIMEMCNDLVGPGCATRVRLATNRDTGRPRGFGHIDFDSPESAKKAVAELNGISLLGREIRVDHAMRKEDMPARPASAGRSNFGGGSKENSVFIGNLSWDMTQEIMEEMIGDILGQGLTSNIRLATDRETGRPKGFAHVDFKDAETAERAVSELNGLEVLGRQLRVDKAGNAPRKKNFNSDTGSFGAF